MKVYSKVKAGAIGGNLGILLVWLLPMIGVPMTPELGAIIATMLGGVFSYFKRELVGQALKVDLNA